METLIIFLIQAVGSQVVGHYVETALKSIDQPLWDMIKKGGDPKIIAEYVNQKNLNNEVDQAATSFARDSIILPGTPKETHSLETRSEFFAGIVETGFRLSSIWKADLLVKGTFFGPLGFMAFRSGKTNTPTVKREGVSAKINHEPGKGFYVVPLRDLHKVEQIWTDYKKCLQTHRGDTNDYVSMQPPTGALDSFYPLIENCDVDEIGATTITFALAFSLKKGGEYWRKELSLSFESEREPVKEWESGLDCFVKSVDELRALFTLPLSEFESIKSLNSRLNILPKKMNS